MVTAFEVKGKVWDVVGTLPSRLAEAWQSLNQRPGWNKRISSEKYNFKRKVSYLSCKNR